MVFERQGEISVGSLSTVAVAAGSDCSQEPRLPFGSPMWVAITQILELLSVVFPGASADIWTGSEEQRLKPAL